jgi:DNA mismatch repair protein MLH3
LSITSHHHQYNSHNTVTAHNAKVLARYTPSLQEQRILTFSHGTRVTVRDLFGSMPVRVKQRANAAEKSSVDSEWARLVRSIVGFLLPWPSAVSLFVRESVHHHEIRLKTCEPALDVTESTSKRVSRLLAQASLSGSFDGESWVSVGASSGGISINGVISLSPAASRRMQFISLGVQPIPSEVGSNAIYEEINRVFAGSVFGLDDRNGNGDAQNSTGDTEELARRDTKVKKGADRWPMFHLKIDISSNATRRKSWDVDTVLDGRGSSLSSIINLLRIVCYEFLKKHHFRPRSVNVLNGLASGSKKRPQSLSTDTTPKFSQKSRARNLGESRGVGSSPFDSWHRIKIGKVAQPLSKAVLGHENEPAARHSSSDEDMSQNRALPKGQSQKPDHPRIINKSGELLRRPFDDVNILIGANGEPRLTVRGMFDDTSMEGSHLPPITTLKPDDTSNTGAKGNVGITPAGIRRSVDGEMPPLKRPRPDGQQPGWQPSEWLKRHIEAWENPVFELTEPLIPRAYHDSSFVAVESRFAKGLHGCSNAFGLSFEISSMAMEGRLSKGALATAVVVSQVDKKFILVKLAAEPRNGLSGNSTLDAPTLLAIIDQHAADERCRLEDLMKDYFVQVSGGEPPKARTEALEKPLLFEVSTEDGGLLRRFGSHFDHWGVIYNVLSDQSKGAGKARQLAQVQVNSLPPSILERCRQEPRLLIETLRKEIWKLGDLSFGAPSQAITSGDSAAKDWIARFHGCPQGIVDLLNSRACRSEFITCLAVQRGQAC